MKSLRSMGLIVACFALAAPFSAQAETPAGWYAAGQIGGSVQTDSDASLSGVTNLVEYKGGWGLSGSGGYAWGNGFRTEGELSYRRSSVDKVKGTGAGTADGGLHNVALMANLFYDFDTGTRFAPYVGFGIGGAVVSPDDLKTINGATFDDERIAFAYQGIAGLAVAMDENWSLTADYRYFATPDVKSGTNGSARGEIENASHNFMLGVRYAFGEAAAPEVRKPYPPLEVVTTPKATLKVAPVAQSYMVFFDFDKAVLTPEAQRVIATAVEAYKKGKKVRIVVTGHTDTMGSDKYNARLSQRRANAVKAEFEKHGVAASNVETAAAGEKQPLVPTSDQVREVQNRRAEIVFK